MENTEAERKYKITNKEVKQKVAKAKEEASKEWYNNMETKE